MAAGGASLTFDPAGALERLGGDLPTLAAARARTREAVAARREALSSVALGADESVVLFGSWGRGELTRGSDDDWALLVAGDGGTTPPEAVAAALAGESRPPGRTGVFGGEVRCEDLISRIGLDADSNANLTRRMLLMLESQPVAGDVVHRRCWERVLDGYLEY